MYFISPLLMPLSLTDFTYPESSSSLCQHAGVVPSAPNCACDPAGTFDARDPDKCWHLLLDQQGVVCLCVCVCTCLCAPLADLQQTTPGLLFLDTINTSLDLRDIVQTVNHGVTDTWERGFVTGFLVSCQLLKCVRNDLGKK